MRCHQRVVVIAADQTFNADIDIPGRFPGVGIGAGQIRMNCCRRIGIADQIDAGATAKCIITSEPIELIV